MAKYNIKAVFESTKKWDKNLADLEVNLRKIFYIDKVSRGPYELSITANVDDKLFLGILGDKAERNGFKFYFIITNYEDVFFTNDVDGKYFPTLFYVEANFPKGILKTNFDSETEIIDNIQEFMNSEYSDFNSAIEAINNHLKSIDKDFYYNVENYVVLGPNWAEKILEYREENYGHK